MVAATESTASERAGKEVNRMRQQYTSWDQVPLVMDLQVAAIILSQSIETMKKRSRAGDFPAFKCGSDWKVTKDDLMAYIESNKVKPSAS